MTGKSLRIEDADAVVDVTGQVCAMPILTAADELRNAADGDLLAIKTGKPEDECEDVENWASRLDGASLVDTYGTDSGVVAFLRRRVTE
jgi:TusA-related sulfurtransferase